SCGAGCRSELTSAKVHSMDDVEDLEFPPSFVMKILTYVAKALGSARKCSHSPRRATPSSTTNGTRPPATVLAHGTRPPGRPWRERRHWSATSRPSSTRRSTAAAASRRFQHETSRHHGWEGPTALTPPRAPAPAAPAPVR